MIWGGDCRLLIGCHQWCIRWYTSTLTDIPPHSHGEGILHDCYTFTFSFTFYLIYKIIVTGLVVVYLFCTLCREYHSSPNVHRYHNNVWHNNARSLAGIPYLTIIASNKVTISVWHFCQHFKLNTTCAIWVQVLEKHYLTFIRKPKRV